MDPNKVISIIVPLDNDCRLIDEVVTEIDQVISKRYRFFEIILVDDGSTDDTPAVAQSVLKKIQRVRYLRLSRKFSRDIALSAGLESAIGDFVATVDPRTDPIEALPDMISICRKTGGIVHGLARNPTTRSILRESLGSLFRSYCHKHIGVDIKRGVSDLRVMSRQAVNALLQVREQNRYLRVLTLSIGYQHEFAPYQMTSRNGGERQPNWASEISTAIDLLAANTRHPLRIVTLLGLVGAFLNLLYALYVVIIYLIRPTVAEGWTTLSLQMSGMFFFICLILTVLSEYVGTILGEVRSRPLYFIAQELTSSVLLEDTVRSSIVKESVG